MKIKDEYLPITYIYIYIYIFILIRAFKVKEKDYINILKTITLTL